jgi:regulator of telomere elongation helicase 1
MNKKNKQFHTKISDIEINFPFQPYDIQIKYMEKVIECLDKGKTNLSALESPTGTGKTLCLLCSVLSWVKKMKKENKFFGKIFYTTRTHSQLSNVIKELNKTNYKPQISVLSSKLHSCINEKIYKNNNELLTIKCKILKHENCEYYNNSFNINKENNELNLINIEELNKYGKVMKFCPYYYEKEKSKNAEVILLPYNYIFDSEIRNKFNINFNNDILIIDEAHNLINVCEDAMSYEINQLEYDSILIDLKNILNIMDMKNHKKIKYLNSVKKDELYKIIKIIENLKLNLINLKEVKNTGECYPKKGRLLKFEEVLNILYFNIFDDINSNN